MRKMTNNAKHKKLNADLALYTQMLAFLVRIGSIDRARVAEFTGFFESRLKAISEDAKNGHYRIYGALADDAMNKDIEKLIKRFEHESELLLTKPITTMVEPDVFIVERDRAKLVYTNKLPRGVRLI